MKVSEWTPFVVSLAGLIAIATLVQQNRMLRRQRKQLLEKVGHRDGLLAIKQERIVTLEARLLIDPLTGLQNRVAFETIFVKEVARALRSGEELALLYVDIDHFKNINDTLGHHIGDEVLRQFAQFLVAASRQEEIISRLGGEEFSILLFGSEPGSALGAAERFRGLVEMNFCREKVPVTVSIGVATLSQLTVKQPKPLLAAADAAMYRAKHDGRNCSRLYDKVIDRPKSEGVERL